MGRGPSARSAPRARGPSPARTRPPGRPADGPRLTDSELTIARLVAQGLTNREVASRLFLSPHTVSMHLRNAFAKLRINSRVELARLERAQEAGG